MSASLPYEQWLNHIRTHSAFYKTQLSHLPSRGCEFERLPVVDVNEYWKGSHDLDNWQVLTDEVRDALVLKTGGTTSQGKMSVYTHAEWQLMLDCFGRSLSAQLVAGDRIANLFFPETCTQASCLFMVPFAAWTYPSPSSPSPVRWSSTCWPRPSPPTASTCWWACLRTCWPLPAMSMSKNERCHRSPPSCLAARTCSKARCRP